MPGSLTVGDINGAGLGVPNLVINPEFTINQRGAASRTATSSAYNFDRWYYDGTNLLQGIESLNLRPGTYVISWEGSSTCAYSLNTAASPAQGAQSYAAVTNGSTITIGTVGSNNLWLRFTGDLANLNKIKLVLGSVATPFEHRPYGQELALCQRYLPAFNSSSTISAFGIGQPVSATSALVLCVFPVQARTTPTGVTVSNLSHIRTRQTNGGDVSYSTSATLTNASTTSAELYLQGGSDGMIAGGATIGFFSNAAGQILFTGCEL